MSISNEDFKNALGQFATGVTVIAYQSEQKIGALTVSSFASLSLDPPLILFNLAKTAGSHDELIQSGNFSVNILADSQEDISNQCANPKTNKQEFLKTSGYTTDQTGSPLLTGCMANLDCQIGATHDGGDHTIIIGRVLATRVDDAKRPLLYFKRKYYSI